MCAVRYIRPTSIVLNKTFLHTIQGAQFGGLPVETVNTLYKDGRLFSHFIEHWLAQHYPLIHIAGCKPYDFVDENYGETKYDQKTFTSYGCGFLPSSMRGCGRTVDKEKFEEHANNLIYCIVSNVNFPEIKVRFVRGSVLLEQYPKGRIPSKDFIKFFD